MKKFWNILNAIMRAKNEKKRSPSTKLFTNAIAFIINIDNLYSHYICPNILTEVNSLANQLGEPERSQCLNTFTLLIS